MPDQPANPSRWRWLWSIAGGAAAVLLAAVVVTWFAGRGFYTDDDAIRISASESMLRQYLWTPPQLLPPEINSARQEYEPSIAPDGDELLFVRGKPGSNTEIYASRRREGKWSAPAPLKAVNSPHDELGPSITGDGKWLLFYSDRPGGSGQYDIWAAPREGEGWGSPFNLGPSVNSPFNDYGPAMTPDGKRLFFASNRKAASKYGPDAWRATIRQGELGDYDLYVAGTDAPATQPTTRPAGLAFAAAAEVPGANTPHHEGACAVSPAGDFLYFASNRPGGLGGFDLYRARLKRPSGELGEVQNLGAPVNTSANETDPNLADGGFRLYFSSDRDSGEVYRLFTSESREVYAMRDRAALPAIGWSWWLLLIAVALLVPILLMLQGTGSRHLSLIQRCLLLSLLLHILLTILFSATRVTRDIVAYVRAQQGEPMLVDLSSSREAEIALQVRSQITDIQVPTAAPAELSRIQTPEVVVAPPKPVEVELPQVDRRPTAIQIEATAPPVAPPKPTDRIEMALPEMKLETPALAVQPPRPQFTVNAEPKLEAPAVKPLDLAPQAPTPVTIVDPNLAATDPAPIAPRAESRADAPAEARPAVTSVDPMLPEAKVEVDRPETTNPIQRTAVISAEPDTPQVAEVFVQSQPQQAAAAPTTRPAMASAQVPAAAPAAESRAQASPIAPATVSAAAQPAQPQVTVAAQAPTVVQPEMKRPAVTDAGPDVPQVAEATVATVQQATGAPVTGPAKVDLAVPAAQAAQQSSAVAAAVELQPVQVNAPVAIDVPVKPGAVELKLPTPAPVQPIHLTEPTLPTVAVNVPDPLQARPVPSARVEAVRPLDVTAPPPALADATRTQSAVQVTISPIKPMVPPILADTPGPAVGPVPVWSSPDGLGLPANLAQRSYEARQELLKQLGGTEQSEAAVARALSYLSRQQERDGRWTIVEQDRPARRGGRSEHDSALTALSTLAFLASDHTHAKPGPYQETVTRAMGYLLSIERNGDLRSGGDMYDQGIATIAVAEAAIMTGDTRFREAALRAGKFIERSIDRQTGGWRYTPGQAGDTSVMGWQLMALKSVSQLGQPIPDDIRAHSLRFLDSVGYGRQRMLAAYQPGQRRTNAMAAEGAFCRILLGHTFTPEQRQEICDFLLSDLPGKGEENFYYWYYASMTLRQLQDDAWTQWNPNMRDTLIRLQRQGGALDGSWDYDKSRHGNRAGRVYSTAVATLTLEVYYRYLPMYGAGKKE